jgi:pyridoxal phosphate enzyme (YggS family)
LSTSPITTEAAARLTRVRDQIAGACRRAGRDPGSVELVAVSKYADISGVVALADAGQRLFGENRVQQALLKIEALASQGLKWHMVGHVQSNKARLAAQTFAMVESVDSLALAEALARTALEGGNQLPALLQVNVDGDPRKHGFYTGQVGALYAAISGLGGLQVQGLMTIGALSGGLEGARPTFAALRHLRDHLDAMGVAPPLRHLSMGMSADYEVAISEGATIVRVGRALFEPEPNSNTG